MLDENLPTFRFKPSTDNPLSNILYFTQNGNDPAAEYVFRRADPALPASHRRYAVALCDPINPAVIYGEVMVEPEWSQPTLSAAELRAQQQSGAPPAPATPLVPDSFSIQLYNPDQTVSIKMVTGGFTKSDSWEFEMPVQSFRQPSSSELDRQQDTSPADLVPRVMFRWKKDGRLSKDLTCYMSGTSLGGRKNKEPDITIALFKAAKDSVLTIYQPNLHRVEVEDRKGLEVVLLLAAEVIKDLFVAPRADAFNTQGSSTPPATANGGKRKNSRPNVAFAVPVSQPSAAPAMSGAAGNKPPTPEAAITGGRPGRTTSPPRTALDSTPISTAEIDAETRRLQAMVEKEEREREKRERAEQKRIKKMLEEEEKERRRREAEVAKETERLRKKYGTDGQDLPPLPPRKPNTSANNIPPPITSPPPQHFAKPQYPPPQYGGGLGPWSNGPPALPPRPVSAGPAGRPTAASNPSSGPFHCSTLNAIWNGPGGNGWNLAPPQHMTSPFHGPQQPPRPERRRGGSTGREDERRRVQKKRSSHW